MIDENELRRFISKCRKENTLRVGVSTDVAHLMRTYDVGSKGGMSYPEFQLCKSSIIVDKKESMETNMGVLIQRTFEHGEAIEKLGAQLARIETLLTMRGVGQQAMGRRDPAAVTAERRSPDAGTAPAATAPAATAPASFRARTPSPGHFAPAFSSPASNAVVSVPLRAPSPPTVSVTPQTTSPAVDSPQLQQ